jgi:hypothetical protein
MLAMVLFAGCDPDGAMKATNDMPAKIDDTNRKIDDTNGKIDDTNVELQKTSDAIRLQKLAIAKEGMEDPQNGVYLEPFPTGIVAFAKTFAETGTEEELVGQIYLYVTEINRSVPPKKVNEKGEPVEYTAQEVQNIKQYKKQRLMAAKAVCAFIPQAMIDEIVKTEIVDGGRYKSTALAMLMFRFNFLGDILLDKSIMEEGITSVGMLEKALEYSRSMETVASYPFVSEITWDITGLADANIDNTMAGAVSNIADRLGSIQFQVTLNLSEGDLSQLDADPLKNDELKAQLRKRLDLANSEVQSRLEYWEAQAPIQVQSK